MIRVVIFCRVSTKVQDYQRQINDLTECAELRGWSVEKSFCETISGATKNTKRKELLAMLDYIAQNDIKKVLVTELSRLGRDTLQVLEVIDMLNEAGVSLYIQNYNIETLTPEGKINFINSGGRVGRKPGYRKTDDLLLVEYAEELRLLKKGISLRNVSKLTGTSVNTLRKCKALLN